MALEYTEEKLNSLATKIDLVTLSLEGKYSVFRYGCGERATALNIDKIILHLLEKDSVFPWPDVRWGRRHDREYRQGRRRRHGGVCVPGDCGILCRLINKMFWDAELF